MTLLSLPSRRWPTRVADFRKVQTMRKQPPPSQTVLAATFPMESLLMLAPSM